MDTLEVGIPRPQTVGELDCQVLETLLYRHQRFNGLIKVKRVRVVLIAVIRYVEPFPAQRLQISCASKDLRQKIDADVLQ